MPEREQDKMRPPALRPAGGRTCIVMVCTDMSEADQVGRLLSELNNGYLITYRRAEDMVFNAPGGKVALVILATRDQPRKMRRTLRWLRTRWPKCPLTVIADDGCGDQEMAAREGGANFLARPVASRQWSAMLAHALGDQVGSKTEGVAR